MQFHFYLPKGQVQKFQVSKKKVVIGRSKDCDIVIVYDGFSRKHAMVELIENDLFITDLDSKNGVLIDGKKINPGERTLIQSFLNLQIGPAFKVEIKQELALDSELNSFKKENSNVHSLEEFTRTIMRESKKIKRIPTKKKSNSKKKKLPFFFLPVLVFAIGVFLFMASQDKEEPVKGKAQDLKSAPLKITSTFIPASSLEIYAKDLSCSGSLADWCKSSGILNLKNEGAVIVGTSVILFMNMSVFFDQNYNSEFNQLPEPKRLEILLLKKIFTSNLMLFFTSQATVDNLQVIGGLTKNETMKWKMIIKLNRDIDLSPFNNIFMLAAFDQALNQGDLSKLSKISSLFEVLPLD